MHLVSRADQVVHVPGAEVAARLRTGDSIWTESSYRYERDEIVAVVDRAGFRCEVQWVDAEWPFAQSLHFAV
jgi:uncharacterized SAM-dependent methyltransferase